MCVSPLSVCMWRKGDQQACLQNWFWVCFLTGLLPFINMDYYILCFCFLSCLLREKQALKPWTDISESYRETRRELEQKSFCFRMNHTSPDLVHGNCLHSLLDHWSTRRCFVCCFPWPVSMDRVSLTLDSIPLSPASWIASLNLELLLVEGQSTKKQAVCPASRTAPGTY